MPKEYKQTKYKYIIGIDEAGRGPLAGPLVVGGVLLIVKNFKEEWKILKGIRDSKKLSAKKREEWFTKIKKHPQLCTAHVIISPKIIDKINIFQAALIGANKVYQQLVVHLSSDRLISGLPEEIRQTENKGNIRNIENLKIFLDGSLKLPSLVKNQFTIIKGDEKIPSIAAASIVAKVTRDRIMRRLHKKFPEYGFDRHKGYGTKMHKIALAKFGISFIHRKTFSGYM